MQDAPESPRSYLDGLPDEAHWIDVRGLARSGRSRIVGESVQGFFVLDTEGPLVCAVGRPDPRTTARMRELRPDLRALLAEESASDHVASVLGGWVPRPVALHTHGDPASLAPDPDHRVHLLESSAAQELAHLPAALREELEGILGRVPCCAVFLDRRPVSFCYAAFETESLWDISIDTLEEHRRKGFARSAVSRLVTHQLERGKHPIWGCLVENTASLELARRMGFRRAQGLVELSAPR